MEVQNESSGNKLIDVILRAGRVSRSRFKEARKILDGRKPQQRLSIPETFRMCGYFKDSAVLALLVVAATVAYNTSTKFRRTRLRPAPGTLLLKISDFLWSPKTVDLTFRPLIADYQAEYFEAKFQKRNCKAQWIRVRYCWAYAKASGLTKLGTFVKDIVSVTKK